MLARLSAASTPTKAPTKVFAFATEPPLNVPLVEHACGCSSVRGGCGFNVRARLFAASTTTEAPAKVFAFATEPPWNLAHT